LYKDEEDIYVPQEPPSKDPNDQQKIIKRPDEEESDWDYDQIDEIPSFPQKNLEEKRG